VSVESQGLVIRIPGQSDSRDKIVFLTEHGGKVIHRVTGLLQRLLNKAGRGFFEEDMKVCKDCLRRATRISANFI
jgi:DNA-binding MarR family transcriptional regulator